MSEEMERWRVGEWRGKRRCNGCLPAWLSGLPGLPGLPRLGVRWTIRKVVAQPGAGTGAVLGPSGGGS